MSEDLGSCYADNRDASWGTGSATSATVSTAAGGSGRVAAPSTARGASSTITANAVTGTSSLHTSPVKGRPGLLGPTGAGPGSGAPGSVQAADAPTQVHEVVMGALRERLSLHGGQVADHLHHGVTHIVMRPEQLGRICKIRVCVSGPLLCEVLLLVTSIHRHCWCM